MVACWLKNTEDLNKPANGVICDTVHKLHQAILFGVNVTQLYSTHVNVILVVAVRKVWLSLQ